MSVSNPTFDYALLLTLVADPYQCYQIDTITLERIMARLPGLQHGRRPGDAIFDAAETLRVQIAATLCARACLDKQSQAVQATIVQARGIAPLPGNGGGVRVPVNPPRPGPLPPAVRVPELEAL